MGDGLRSYSTNFSPAQCHVPTYKDDKQLELLLLLKRAKIAPSQSLIVDEKQLDLNKVFSSQKPTLE